MALVTAVYPLTAVLHRDGNAGMLPLGGLDIAFGSSGFWQRRTFWTLLIVLL